MAFKEQVIKEFDDLRKVGNQRIRVRVVVSRPRAEPQLDIREYIESASFTGFTKRGSRLSAEEVSLLGTMIPGIEQIVSAPPTPPSHKSYGTQRRHQVKK